MRHMRARMRARVGLAAAMTIVLCSLLAGCAEIGTITSAPNSSKAPATPIPTEVVHCAAPSLPQGWTWYTDTRYRFRLAVPPGWRTGSFEYILDGSNQPDSPSHIHVVDLFGPESIGMPTSSGKQRGDTFSPVMVLEVDVGSGARHPSYGSGSMTNWYAQKKPLCIGTTVITPYLFTNDEGDVEWAVVLPKGPEGYLYDFNVASHADTATRDGMLFQAMLASFTPLADA